VERRIHSSAHPERVSAFAILVTLVLLGGGVTLSGGPRSPMLPWLVLPAGMVAARFRPQVVVAGLVLTVCLILATTLGVHPDWTINDPVPVIATLALLAVVVSIVWALEAAELHHRDEAILDPLTGLLNRHALAPRFAELSHQARLTDQPVCLVLCDVDNFKAINDEHGHDRGDAALRDVAYELRKRLRSFELVYRLGGEEFLIVLPGIELRDGRHTAERLRTAIEDARPTGIPTSIHVLRIHPFHLSHSRADEPLQGHRPEFPDGQLEFPVLASLPATTLIRALRIVQLARDRRAGNIRLVRRRAGHRIRDRDLEDLERPPQRTLKVYDRLCQVRLGAHLGGGRGSQGLLVGDHQEDRRGSQVEFLLLGIERLLLQFARQLCGCDRCAVLLQGNQRILNVHHDVVDRLLLPCLILPLGEQRARVIGLGHAVSDGKVQCQLRLELRVGSLESLAESVAEASDDRGSR